jgi:uncharacterized protein YqeY
MSLKDQLIEDMKQAMKAKDSLKLDVIKLLRSRIKNVEIDNGEQNDEQVQKIVQQQIKQWKDAIVDYKKGDRQDLVKEAEAKVEILQSYLPEQLSDEEIKKTVKKIMEETGLDQIGPLIGKVKAKLGNQADGASIAKVVKEMLKV